MNPQRAEWLNAIADYRSRLQQYYSTLSPEIDRADSSVEDTSTYQAQSTSKDASTDHANSTAKDLGSYQAEPTQGEEGRNSESNQSWSDTESYESYKNHIYPQDQRETTNQKEEWLGILENIQQLIQVKVNLTAKGRAEPKVNVSIFSFF